MLWSTPLNPHSNSSISCNNSIHNVNLQRPSNVILMQCACQKRVLGNSPLFEYSLKTKDRQFDNVVVIGGTVSCHNDNLWMGNRAPGEKGRVLLQRSNAITIISYNGSAAFKLKLRSDRFKMPNAWKHEQPVWQVRPKNNPHRIQLNRLTLTDTDEKHCFLQSSARAWEGVRVECGCGWLVGGVQISLK